MSKKLAALLLSVAVVFCSLTFVASAAPADDSFNRELAALEQVSVPAAFRQAMEQQSDALESYQKRTALACRSIRTSTPAPSSTTTGSS